MTNEIRANYNLPPLLLGTMCSHIDSDMSFLEFFLHVHNEELNYVLLKHGV